MTQMIKPKYAYQLRNSGLGTDDVATTLEALPPVIRDYEIASRKSFPERVRVKRRALGLA